MQTQHLCECGCGQPTALNKTYDSKRGLFPGQPNRFIRGHGARGRRLTPEQSQRQRDGLRGHVVTAETRAKIAARLRATGHRPPPEFAYQPGHVVAKREAHPSWKGGRSTLNGYPAVYQPEHPRAYKTGYVYEHIMVMERALGRPLGDGEVVHHEDGDKQNNEPGNLRLFGSQAEHVSHHHALKHPSAKD